MNMHMTRAEWKALPFRDDVEGDYVSNALYRAKGDDHGVYRFVGTPSRPDWWSFTVKFEADSE
jgi:hypothetical protein